MGNYNSNLKQYLNYNDKFKNRLEIFIPKLKKYLDSVRLNNY